MLTYVAISLLLLALLFTIHRLFLSPLSKLPGPSITAVTQICLMYHEFRGDRTIWVDSLHTRYGPIVRLSPTEASFNSQEALRDIYGAGSAYGKSEFYDMFIYYGERNTFTSLSKPAVCVLGAFETWGLRG